MKKLLLIFVVLMGMVVGVGCGSSGIKVVKDIDISDEEVDEIDEQIELIDKMIAGIEESVESLKKNKKDIVDGSERALEDSLKPISEVYESELRATSETNYQYPNLRIDKKYIKPDILFEICENARLFIYGVNNLTKENAVLFETYGGKKNESYTEYDLDRLVEDSNAIVNDLELAKEAYSKIKEGKKVEITDENFKIHNYD